MKIKHLLFGILTFVLGFILIILLVALFSNNLDKGSVNSSIFNAGIYAIVFSNLLTTSALVVCTIIIISILKNQK